MKTQKHWFDYLEAAQERVAKSVETYGDSRYRAEDTSGAQGANGEDEGGDDGAGVDLANPAVQQAIQAAVARERQAAMQREQGLRENRDQILGEKKLYAELGKPDEIRERLERLQKLETDVQAAGVNADPDEFRRAVEEAAQRKYVERERSLSDVMTSKDAKIEELTKATEALAAEKHRSFVAEQLLRAAMPEDYRVVQDGAWDYLIDTLAPHVVAHEVPGLGAVARLQKGEGTLVPGSGPDNLMDLRELLPLARQGKGPIPNLGFCFVSAGRGSGTTSPSGGKTSAGNWWKMSNEQRIEYTKENGLDAAKALMEKSPQT
jgi:hypothetical protein